MARSEDLIMLGGRVVQYLGQLAVVLIVPKVLGPEQFVSYSLLMPLAALGMSLLFGWLGTALNRHVYDLLSDPDRLVRSTASIYYGSMSVLLMTASLVASQFTNSIYVLIPPLLVANALKTVSINLLNASSNHRGFFAANLAYTLSLAVFLTLCYELPELSLASKLLVFAISDIVISIIAWAWLGLIAFDTDRLFDKLVAKEYFRYGLPLVVKAVTLWVISLSDRYILTIWEDTHSVASYILSYQLAGSSITVPMSFLIAVLRPKILRLDKDMGIESAVSYTYGVLGKLYKLMPVVFLAACVVVLFVKYKYFPEYGFDPEVIVTIVLAHIVFALTDFYNKEFELNGKTMVITKAIGLGAIVNTALNLALIPYFGALGAAFATLVAYSVAVSMLFRKRTICQ